MSYNGTNSDMPEAARVRSIKEVCDNCGLIWGRHVGACCQSGPEPRIWKSRVSSNAAEAPGGQLGTCDWTTYSHSGLHANEGVCRNFKAECPTCKTSLAPAAPSERADERERFEQECRKRKGFSEDELHQYIPGMYLNPLVSAAWEGWQARAGLSSQEGK